MGCSLVSENQEKASNRHRETKPNKEYYKQRNRKGHTTNGWVQFTETLNDRSNSKHVWGEMRKIKFTCSSKIFILKDENEGSVSKLEKADLLATTYLGVQC